MMYENMYLIDIILKFWCYLARPRIHFMTDKHLDEFWKNVPPPPPPNPKKNVENYFKMIAWKEGYPNKIISNQLH